MERHLRVTVFNFRVRKTGCIRCEISFGRHFRRMWGKKISSGTGPPPPCPAILSFLFLINGEFPESLYAYCDVRSMREKATGGYS